MAFAVVGAYVVFKAHNIEPIVALLQLNEYFFMPARWGFYKGFKIEPKNRK